MFHLLLLNADRIIVIEEKRKYSGEILIGTVDTYVFKQCGKNLKLSVSISGLYGRQAGI